MAIVNADLYLLTAWRLTKANQKDIRSIIVFFFFLLICLPESIDIWIWRLHDI